MNRSTRWVALATAVMAVLALGSAVTTPPRSGPNCRSGCIGFPYTDAAAFVPRDYLWMYPAIVLSILTVLLAVFIYASLPAHHQPKALAGVCFAAIAAGALVVDYGIQLTVLQPALLARETEGLSVWSQYNPHGIFIALEDIGYAVLALALLTLGLSLRTGEVPPARRSGLVRITGWIFIGGGAATLLLLVALGIGYGARLEYRFEVFSLLVTWLALIAGGATLSRAK